MSHLLKDGRKPGFKNIQVRQRHDKIFVAPSYSNPLRSHRRPLDVVRHDGKEGQPLSKPEKHTPKLKRKEYEALRQLNNHELGYRYRWFRKYWALRDYDDSDGGSRDLNK